jgi:hypothetical protein
LLKLPVCVSAARDTSTGFDDIEDPLDGKWNLPLCLNESKCTAIIPYCGQLDEPTVLDQHSYSGGTTKSHFEDLPPREC